MLQSYLNQSNKIVMPTFKLNSKCAQFGYEKSTYGISTQVNYYLFGKD